VAFRFHNEIRINGSDEKARENLSQYIGRLSASMPSPTLVHPCTSPVPQFLLKRYFTIRLNQRFCLRRNTMSISKKM